jgi:hypothetical protein
MTTLTEVTVEAVGKDGKRFKVGPNWYSGFKASQLGGLESGDTVTFTFKDTGTWKNLVGDVQVVSKGAGGARTSTFKDPGPSTQKVGSVILDRDRTIARQNALTNARELYLGLYRHHIPANTAEEGEPDAIDYASSAQDIIDIAYKFEAYTTGDIEKDNAKKAFEELQKEFNA